MCLCTYNMHQLMDREKSTRQSGLRRILGACDKPTLYLVRRKKVSVPSCKKIIATNIPLFLKLFSTSKPFKVLSHCCDMFRALIGS